MNLGDELRAKPSVTIIDDGVLLAAADDNDQAHQTPRRLSRSHDHTAQSGMA